VPSSRSQKTRACIAVFLTPRFGCLIGFPSFVFESTGDALKCYTGYSPYPQPVTEQDYPAGDSRFEFCARYEFRCQPSIPACTQQDTLRGIYKWVYGPLSGAQCRNISAITGPLYRNLLCCTEDSCNTPLETLTDPADQGGTGGDSESVSPGTASPGAALRCYTGYSPSAEPIAPKDYSYQAGVMDACASYQFVCSSGQTACSQEEQLQGKVKWAYVPMSQESCAELKDTTGSSSSSYSSVKCCTEDLCNKPDPALDPNAQLAEGGTSSSAAAGARPQLLMSGTTATFLAAIIAAGVFFL
jgi:hypothetical protein